jgi:hypothetical protein
MTGGKSNVSIYAITVYGNEGRVHAYLQIILYIPM